MFFLMNPKKIKQNEYHICCKLRFYFKDCMKKYLFGLSVLLLFACSKRNDDNNCRFLLNLGVNVNVNMNLPQYSILQYPNNPVYIANHGNGGIVVNNVGSGYRAFDAADPNHEFGACSILTISGINGICGCADANEYNFLTGQPMNNGNLRCGLKEYRVDVSGNTLIITN